MINPNWDVVDLDPHTWRALGRYLKIHNISVLPNPVNMACSFYMIMGKLLRIVDTRKGLRTDLSISAVDDPAQIAHQLYQTGEWQRVHVINKPPPGKRGC